jgi:hypothetical protein
MVFEDTFQMSLQRNAGGGIYGCFLKETHIIHLDRLGENNKHQNNQILFENLNFETS